MERYEKKYDLKEENNKMLILEQETVDELITKLRDTRFSNEQTRKEFIHIIAQLASIPDKTARTVIKKIGDYMTELGTEILNDSSSLNMDDNDIEEKEPYIVNMDEGGIQKKKKIYME